MRQRSVRVRSWPQRAQQFLLESPRLYSAHSAAASHPMAPTLTSSSAPSASPSLIVIDTNVVFDLFVFAEPASGALRDAIDRGAVRWIATRAMADECLDVVERGALKAWNANPAALRAAWQRRCEMVNGPSDMERLSAPRCSDPDDQIFIDLAIARRARWLFTKDRAVLRLSARLRPFGVEVRSPEGWSLRSAQSGAAGPAPSP